MALRASVRVSHAATFPAAPPLLVLIRLAVSLPKLIFCGETFMRAITSSITSPIHRTLIVI
jgi:hypothetical protein